MMVHLKTHTASSTVITFHLPNTLSTSFCAKCHLSLYRTVTKTMNQGPYYTCDSSKFVEHCTTSDFMASIFSFYNQLQLICVSHEEYVSFIFNF